MSAVVALLTYSYNMYHKLCKQQTVSNTNKCVEDEAVEVDYETDDVLNDIGEECYQKFRVKYFAPPPLNLCRRMFTIKHSYNNML